MKFVLFYHSLVSDWNHGNAHFLRGVASELLSRGHDVCVYEPQDGWSRRHLLMQEGEAALARFAADYPGLMSTPYCSSDPGLDRMLDGADVVIVHEWTEPQMVSRIGRHLAGSGCRSFFHDTHHRSVTQPEVMAALDLRDYDGVLAFGASVAERYRQQGWARHAWVWHEAADIRRFHPLPGMTRRSDLVWVGNWGDEERTAELREFLVEPVAQLQLSATVYGVRYPRHARSLLRAANIEYAGWIPNSRVSEAFARHRCTVHIPRRAYAEALQGVPTIRMFEALACGIPLVSAPWSDCEHLFRPGTDYLVAQNGSEMRGHLRAILSDKEMAGELARQGRQSILARHTCAHRVDQLLRILSGLQGSKSHAAAAPASIGTGA